jgi:RNA polymerase sigma factor (sigma-70 family)
VSSRDSREAEEFKPWLEANGPWLRRTAHFVTPDRETGEDIAQEAVIKLFKAWTNESLREKILTSRSYVGRLVLNCYLDHKKVKSRTNECEEEFADERHHVEVEFGSGLEVRQALRRLCDAERHILFLTFYCDLTKTAAGQELGISPSSASRLYKRALSNMKVLLNEEED